MPAERSVLVDFIAEGDRPGEWRMVLVEEGPWSGAVESHLRRIQERLYGCIDAALDGQLAARFPQTAGKRLVIRLDCYDVPKAEVAAFFDGFSTGVLRLPDYRRALRGNCFVTGIAFEINFDAIH